MSTVIDNLTAFRDDAATNYRNLVRAAAAGDDAPDGEAVHTILTLAGKTPGDLARDIAERESRIQAVADLNEAKGMDDEIRKAIAEQHKADSKVASLRGELLGKVRAAEADAREAASRAHTLQRLQNEQRAAAEKMLRQTADPSIQVAIDRLQEQAAPLRTALASYPRSRIYDLEQQLARAERNLKALDRDSMDQNIFDARKRQRLLATELEAARQLAEQLEPKAERLAEIDERIAALQRSKLQLDPPDEEQ